MKYVTNIERQGIQKGLQQGLQQGLLQKSREDLIEVLKARFQRLSKTLVVQIEAIEDVSLLATLHREAVVIDSLASFSQRLQQAVAD